MKNELALYRNVYEVPFKNIVNKELPQLMLQAISMSYDLEDCVILANLSSAPNTVDLIPTADFMEKCSTDVADPMKLISYCREKRMVPGACVKHNFFSVVGLGNLTELSKMKKEMEESIKDCGANSDGESQSKMKIFDLSGLIN